MEDTKEPAKRSVRLDDDVWERLQALPGKSINDGLRALLDGADVRISETLELVRSLPDLDAIREAFEEILQEKIDERQAQRASNPAAVTGVTQGYAGLGKPRYESRQERLEREKQDRMDKARARSSVGDDPSYVFDPEYVQD